MTTAVGAVGPAGVPAQPAVPSGAAASDGPTFAQALATAFAAAPAATAAPTSPAAAAPPGASGPTAMGAGITLGQMLGLGSMPRALPPIPAAAAAEAVSGPLPIAGNGMVRPADGRISSEFGPRVHPVTGQQRPHNGIDVAGPVGAPIRAAADGTVTFAGVRGGYGNLIIVDHGDGRETYYAHNSANGVSAGDRVSAGQHIGAVGATGQVTGPHLHFEVRVNGTPVEPRDHVAF